MTTNKTAAAVVATENNKIFAYDAMPYPIFTSNYISPEHLELIGTIFKTHPADVKTARVLEIGCGIGLTSIAFGFRHPNSKVIGVDLSKVQIDTGKKYVDSLKLENVELKAMSIMDIDKSFGEFDYIICHGVYSEVPTEVQQKILEVIETRLAPNGLAHVSYKALPGWNIAQTFKDMMQYHAEMFETEEEKLTQAYAFIKFIDGALQESNTPYSKFLKTELAVIANQDINYVRHEYLADNHSPLYFSDFIAKASQHNLAYVGDSILAQMYIGNLPQEIVEKLKVVDNIVSQEQYMDFITNKRFRNTILCKANVPIDRNITPDIFEKLYTSMNIIPTIALEKVDFKNEKENLEFKIEDLELTFNTNSVLHKSIFYTFAQHRGRLLSLNEIAAEVTKVFPTLPEEQIKASISAMLVELLFQGLLVVRLTPPASIDKVSNNPKISDLTRYEVLLNSSKLTNQYSDSMSNAILERLVVLYSDGKNTVEQIVDNIQKHVEKGELNIQDNNKVVSDPVKQKETIKALVNQSLEALKKWYYLIG